jgi:2-polyprenyl-3-methyl-5-hydroxy-6-metoxy-1,4-benzoquinol methylase
MSVNAIPRIDLQVIADLITPQAKVLDVGCGDGECWSCWSATSKWRAAASRSPRVGSTSALDVACQ